MNRKANKLVNEKSPYLLQHCYNPVNWYPWGEEAFSKAKELNLPIFLSVGYSTCHWCHVMEKESFENERIAKLLNDNFVSIKVDREERPDIDRLYMTFIQKISGDGGWPMSVFLTPNLEPLTGGTYFPPSDTCGQMGFPTVLITIVKQWREKQAELLEQAKTSADALRDLARTIASSGGLPATSMALKSCCCHFAKQFDDENGGFGIEPKFPKPVDQMFLLQYYKQNPTTKTGENALHIVGKTLEKMALGGIHDHVGKGFHRYTVDAEWKLPHFEKMLYDEGQLLELYANYYKISGQHLDVVHDIAEYLSKNLSHPEGGFFCAEDADSLPHVGAEDKQEGAFCTWTKAEVEEVLYDHPARFNENLTLDELACTAFNVMENGNIPTYFDFRNELTGKNVLRLIDAAAMEKYASECRMSVDKLKVCLEDAKRFLAERRATRPPPHMDRKVLTSWNALAISGFCAAATIAPIGNLADAASGIPYGQAMTTEIADAYRECASKALTFVRKHLTDPISGDLLHSVYATEQNELVQVQPAIKAFSNDYAFLIQALLDMYETDFDETRLQWAFELQTSMDKEFWDAENNSGYYLSRVGDSSIFARVQNDQDMAEPCTNSVAMANLLRLAALFDSKDFAKRAEDILRGSAKLLETVPHVLVRMVSALYLYDNAVPEITVVGSKNDNVTWQMISEIQAKFIPRKYLVFIDIDKKNDSILVTRNEHFAALASCGPKASVYICKDQVCEMPLDSVDELKKRLSQP